MWVANIAATCSEEHEMASSLPRMHPSSPAPSLLNYFLAVYPNLQNREALRFEAEAVLGARSLPGSLRPASQLHLTLLHLGWNLDDELIVQLNALLTSVTFSPFELVFDRAEVFRLDGQSALILKCVE